jgi:amidohydrolase
MLDTKALDKLIAFRKKMHTNPELSKQESQTAKRIASFLKDCKPAKIITKVGGHGILAIFDSGKEGDTLLFRADMDALPIQEKNDFEHRSKVDGVSHKCGHDGHTTILLGLATLLSKNPPKKGKAILLFQPAEEIGKGAAAVLSDEKFKEIQPDWVFGLHNLPGYPLHEVVVKNDSFTASVVSLVVGLNGKTAHAAEPENGINPSLAVSELLLQASVWSNNSPERDDFTVVTPVHVNLGNEAYGTSAGGAKLGFTIRTWTEEEMEQLKAKMETFLISLAEKHRLELNFKYIEEFKACENNPDAVEQILNATNQLNLKITKPENPFKWGEDFGLFTQQYKGAFFGIGAGKETPALHNPDFDFPDELIPTGAQLFHELCKKNLACQ